MLLVDSRYPPAKVYHALLTLEYLLLLVHKIKCQTQTSMRDNFTSDHVKEDVFNFSCTFGLRQ